MTIIVQISDLHCSKSGFRPKKLTAAIKEINKLMPHAVIITGDLTMHGKEEEFILAKRYIQKIKAKKLIIPGNHDARLVGYEYFDEIFGHGRSLP